MAKLIAIGRDDYLRFETGLVLPTRFIVSMQHKVDLDKSIPKEDQPRWYIDHILTQGRSGSVCFRKKSEQKDYFDLCQLFDVPQK